MEGLGGEDGVGRRWEAGLVLCCVFFSLWDFAFCALGGSLDTSSFSSSYACSLPCLVFLGLLFLFVWMEFLYFQQLSFCRAGGR